ncbi:MAG: hypothetical protein M1834_007492 [Cirrosporium novae-zelandiae]|nr:MAG: hypothetical protein M1834_007492 [Cirrosporium novae-zelandiae]
MAGFSTITLLLTWRLLLLGWSSSSVHGAPIAGPALSVSASVSVSTSSASSSSYWVANIDRQGTVAFNSNSTDYEIFRNVKDYGAVGDGTTDDTTAINLAISSGQRCGLNCDSTTLTPALVYFPEGTYLVSTPIIQYYYTQLVGDALNPPTLKAAASFTGMAVIDADPYEDDGSNWYTNQNNFFRQIRNFVIDLTSMPESSGAGIHWQVAQATSLQNIRFEMIQGGTDNKQEGIFMDNGSGGFMSDLVFNGGNYGAYLGSQQFTTRNLTFNNCKTAMYVNWDWVWTFKSLEINNCGVGINMSGTDTSGGQLVGSVLVLDSTIGATHGIVTAYSKSGNGGESNGTLIVDNVDFTSSTNAVSDASGSTLLAGGSNVKLWAQGNTYSVSGNSAKSTTSTPIDDDTCSTPLDVDAFTNSDVESTVGSTLTITSQKNIVQGSLTTSTKPSALLSSSNKVFERSKPQYSVYPASSFISVKSNGAKGDGSTDDTAAIQKIFNSAANTSSIVYFDHGAYLVTSTIQVPANIKITGEIWPLIMASGTYFSDASDPHPVFRVGDPGETGSVEISDLIFETHGPQPGAIMMEWNIADPASEKGASAMWDTHFRIGGSAGTELQSDTCVMNNATEHTADASCEGAFMLLHVTEQASIYLENNWFWVADHELDLSDHNQIDIYNGRGVLIESAEGPVWMYGTSAEHSTLYNYQIVNAKNVYMALIQTETPYFQSNPNALTPFTPNTTYSDPTFASCTTDACKKAWGLRIKDSSDVYVFGAGLYSFFDNYDQTCLETESCQENIVAIDGNNTNIELWGLSTKASTNMVTMSGASVVKQSANEDTYCSTVALFEVE